MRVLYHPIARAHPTVQLNNYRFATNMNYKYFEPTMIVIQDQLTAI